MLTTPTPAWFEIPAADLSRARRFYESLFAKELRLQEMGPMKLAIFPSECPQSTGALVECEGYEPTTSGSIVYLEVDDVKTTLARANEAGADTLCPITALPNDGGFFAQFRDSEGNRVGLYSKTTGAN
ncbi:MAG: VOC family protein [Myxococcales bacterium]|nr:VOC family protein [Myxococcales bacterium]